MMFIVLKRLLGRLAPNGNITYLQYFTSTYTSKSNIYIHHLEDIKDFNSVCQSLWLALLYADPTPPISPCFKLERGKEKRYAINPCITLLQKEREACVGSSQKRATSRIGWGVRALACLHAASIHWWSNYFFSGSKGIASQSGSHISRDIKFCFEWERKKKMKHLHSFSRGQISSSSPLRKPTHA